MLLAIDPSIVSPGVALFNRAGELVAAFGCLRVSQPRRKRSARVCHGARAYYVANEIAAWACFEAAPAAVRELVFEWPKAYTLDKSKASADSLFGLPAVGMAVAGMLGVSPVTYLPKEWAGSTKKFTTGRVWESPRAQRIRSRLGGEELHVWESVKKSHDAIDAIGIGLHRLGRLKRKRVFHGAT